MRSKASSGDTYLDGLSPCEIVRKLREIGGSIFQALRVGGERWLQSCEGVYPLRGHVVFLLHVASHAGQADSSEQVTISRQVGG